jgi:CheY-like chemotaxis protein
VIEAALPEELPPVTGDPVRVKQILFNLLSNAVKFSPRDSKVTVRAEHLGAAASPLGVEAVRVDVVDRGIGIRKEDQEVIFEEFRQVDGSSSRRYEGSGLGLALVRRLLEMHGGQVRVESEPGQGSTFSAFLPVSARLHEPLVIEAERPSPEPTRGGERGQAPRRETRKTILVVEDESDVHDLLQEGLEPAGYRVLRATAGEEGLELARTEGTDLVVLDLLMPGMSGFEVAFRLRADSRTAGIPVIVFTAKELTPSDHAVLSGKFATLVPKGPDAVAQLTTAIHGLLGEG